MLFGYKLIWFSTVCLGNGFININQSISKIVPAPTGNRFTLLGVSNTRDYSCIEYVNGSWDTLPVFDINTPNIRSAADAEYVNNTLWAKTHQNNLYRFNRINRNWTHVGNVNGLMVENSGKLYFFAERSVVEFDPFLQQVTDTLSFNFRYPFSYTNLKSVGNSVASADYSKRSAIIWFRDVAVNNSNALTLQDSEWPVTSSGLIGFDNTGAKQVRIDGKPAIFLITPWLTGEINGDKFANVGTYGQGLNINFYAGPISDVYDYDYLHKYERVWKVTRDQIEHHKQNYNNSNYSMPVGISMWPGNGDHTRGEAFDLAPFVDADGNGIYEPHKGDYPRIMGHQAVYTIMSNQRHGNFFSGFEVIDRKMELHLMMYAFDSASISELNNTVFVNYRVFNRGQETWDSVKFALFTDWSLGLGFSPIQEQCGSDSINNVYFSYTNGSSQPAYINQPAAITGSLLNQPLDGHMYFLNNIFSNQNMTDPVLLLDYIRYKNFKWRNGNHLLRVNPSGPNSNDNGNGITPANDQGSPTKWTFNLPDNWYHPQSSASDVRSLPITLLGNIEPNSHRCLEFAFTYEHKLSGGSTNWEGALDSTFHKMTVAKSVYDNLNTGCLGVYLNNETFEEQQTLGAIYPNPVQTGQPLYIETDARIEYVELISMNGTQLRVDVKSGSNRNDVEIPKHLSAGVYLMRIHTAHNGILVKKIMIN